LDGEAVILNRLFDRGHAYGLLVSEEPALDDGEVETHDRSAMRARCW
jgi:hypothetical protein